MGKCLTFDQNRRLSRKRYNIGPQILWVTNRKSYVANRAVSAPVTISDTDVETRDAAKTPDWQVFCRYSCIPLSTFVLSVNKGQSSTCRGRGHIA